MATAPKKNNYSVVSARKRYMKKVNGSWVDTVGDEPATTTALTDEQRQRNHDRIFGRGYQLVFHSVAQSAAGELSEA